MISPPIHRDSFGSWLNEAGLTGIGVEVGCAYGANATNLLSQWTGKTLYLIDPFERQPEEVYKEQGNLVAPYALYETGCRELSERDSRAVVRKGYSIPESAAFDALSLDFVYIDANHAYASVLADLDAWWPKVKFGGIFCGHDFYYDITPPYWNEVDRAVTFWTVERMLTFTVTPCSSWWILKPQQTDATLQ